MCDRISILINGLLTGDKGYPLCYTAYDRKSRWYKIFDKVMFWDKQHCRRTWLARRIHDRPAVSIELKRTDYKSQEDWSEAVHKLDLMFKGPCPDGYRWLRSEHFRWTPDGQYQDWVVTLEAKKCQKNQ